MSKRKFIYLLLLGACASNPPATEKPVDPPKPEIPAPPPPVVILPVPGPIEQSIKYIAATSACAKYSWKDRGRAPAGYIKGMALLYHKNYCALKKGDPVAKAIAAPYRGADRDALAHYGIATGDEHTNLRNAFQLIIGLGLRESSGKYCCGLDRSASNTRNDTAEAGTFQTSWNARVAHAEMPKLLPKYQADKSGCLLDVFKEGVNPAYCTGANAINYGEGTGLEYQKLSKSCPAFHAESSLVGIRNVRKHWGPLNTKAAEFLPACGEMLKNIEGIKCP